MSFGFPALKRSSAIASATLLLGLISPGASSAELAGKNDIPPSVPEYSGEVIKGLDERVLGLEIKPGTLANVMNELNATRLRAGELMTEATEFNRQEARLRDRIGASQEAQRQAREDQSLWKQASDEATAAAYRTRQLRPQIDLNTKSAAELAASQHTYLAAADYATTTYLSAKDREEKAIAAEQDRQRELEALLERKANNLEEAAAIGAKLEKITKRSRSAIPTAVIAGLDMPLLTLDAYLRAERTAAEVLPGCNISWWALAGVGRVESNHGRFRGSFPTVTGAVQPPIIGAPLDGTGNGGNTVPIPATDGGALHGDTEFDHAVGPMQFITTTWMALGADGNGDKARDPQNVYDAALAASKLLCKGAPRGGLVTDSALLSAYKRYNNSDEYAAEVLSWAHRYDGIGLKPVSTE